jgi:hypothetical protein
MNTICGQGLENVFHIDIMQNSAIIKDTGKWIFTSFISNVRYAEKKE